MRIAPYWSPAATVSAAADVRMVAESGVSREMHKAALPATEIIALKREHSEWNC